jgi:hypothetical protein
MKTRLGLGQVDQVAWNTLFLENAHNHVAIAAGAGRGPQKCVSPPCGVEVDIAGYIIVDHQRQVRLRGLQLGFRLGLQAGIGREGNGIGFVNGRRLGLLFGKPISFFERHHLQLVNLLGNLVEFLLKTIIGFHFYRPLHQEVHRMVEILFSGVQMAGLIVGLA